MLEFLMLDSGVSPDMFHQPIWWTFILYINIQLTNESACGYQIYHMEWA